ncbi:hypothetical protein LROSRS0_1217 [Furfurilactobacillus rossiae]|nr:hypothetical protein LROSRS0_1217 [Furfurilactobacillus rossiae]QLE64057.1 hypothetical protein LROSL1_1240 [Furfurilactobacillus rossiae]
MLAQAVMPVVFVLSEKISWGAFSFEGNGGKTLLRLRLCASIPEKCHSDETSMETCWVERGKPLERETQTTVGELHIGN